MSNNNQQPINEHFPSDWGISPEEVKAQIRRRLADSKDIPASELEDHTNDLLQETVHRYMRHVRGNGAASIRKPRAYILEIARNACTEFLKRRKKKLMREVPLPIEQESEGHSSVDSIPDERYQPELILLQKEEQKHLFSLISQLHPPVQMVIKLKAEGAQLREIVHCTSMPLPQVKKCLQEGQERLYQLLILSERSK